MSESESWRSEAAYDYIDKLPPGDLAWEFLRRNPEYRTAYQKLIENGRLTEQAAAEFADQWGLRFRGKSLPIGSRTADFLDPSVRPGHDNARPGSAP